MSLKYMDLTRTQELVSDIKSRLATKADSATSLAGYGITDAYTKTEVDSKVGAAISSVYKPAGSCAFASLPALAAGVLGNVYNVTDAFTTTSDFVEGSGKGYPAGTNVMVVDVGSQGSPSYKFDALAGSIDLSSYAQTADFVAITSQELATMWSDSNANT